MSVLSRVVFTWFYFKKRNEIKWKKRMDVKKSFQEKLENQINKNKEN